jgi:hypothetical protein
MTHIFVKRLSRAKEIFFSWLHLDSEMAPRERLSRLFFYLPTLFLVLTFAVADQMDRYLPGVLALQTILYLMTLFFNAKGFLSSLALLLIYGVYHTGGYYHEVQGSAEVAAYSFYYMWGVLASIALNLWILLTLQHQQSLESWQDKKELQTRLDSMIQLEQQCHNLQVEVQDFQRVKTSYERIQKERTKLKEIIKELEMRLTPPSSPGEILNAIPESTVDPLVAISYQVQTQALQTQQAWKKYRESLASVIPCILEEIKAQEDRSQEREQKYPSKDAQEKREEAESQKFRLLYLQLRQQFEEKQHQLHAARQQLFHTQTQLLTLQLEERLNLGQEQEGESEMLEELQEAIELNEQLQSENEMLEELITSLWNPERNSLERNVGNDERKSHQVASALHLPL